MREKQLFEYAVIRVVPRVEREEFINVGVILFCSAQGFLQTKYELNNERLTSFSKDIDLEELENRMKSFVKICSGGKHAGVIGSLPASGRFRWLTANRSTIVQTSPVHPGLCEDANETLTKLYKDLVL